ncbi:uncharacterized protein LOC134965476 [Pseudophryne corroboree]|uniref:uncharacterized protein LOC134965476 n=1 Tax=Pseudophryne corroboree TaxID=495146 RepID=UPI0030821181
MMVKQKQKHECFTFSIGTSRQCQMSKKQPPQVSATQKHMAHKRHCPDVPTRQDASPSQRRISNVSSRPPVQLLESPPTREPQYPQLPDADNMPPDTQQDTEMEETFVLQLQQIDPTIPTIPPVSTLPTQTTPAPQMSPISPHATTQDQAFWNSWATQQANNLDFLRRQTQFLASLPHQLPRISMSSSRLNVQIAIIANTMELMRADNTHMMNTFQRVMDEQHRQHQNYINILENNLMITESISRIIENHTAATTELNANLSNLNNNISLLKPRQAKTSSGNTTPSMTPVNPR